MSSPTSREDRRHWAHTGSPSGGGLGGSGRERWLAWRRWRSVAEGTRLNPDGGLQGVPPVGARRAIRDVTSAGQVTVSLGRGLKVTRLWPGDRVVGKAGVTHLSYMAEATADVEAEGGLAEVEPPFTRFRCLSFRRSRYWAVEAPLRRTSEGTPGGSSGAVRPNLLGTRGRASHRAAKSKAEVTRWRMER